MQLEIKTEHNNYAEVRFDTDESRKLKNAITEHGGGIINTSRPNRLHAVLMKVFNGHSEFYEYADFDAGTAHGSNGNSFDTNGFSQFLTDYFDEDVAYVDYIEDPDVLQQITDIIADKISDILDEYEEEEGDSHAAKSIISLDAEESKDLRDPEILKDSLIVTEDGVHKLKTQKIEDATSMEEIEDKLRDGMKSTYKNQVDARVNALKQRIESLNSQMEEEKVDMMIEGMQMVGDLDDWEVEDGYLVYQKTVHPEYVQKKYEEGNPVKLTEEAREKFYIDGLKFKLQPNPSDLYYEDAYHPHALSNNHNCTGSFGQPLREMPERAVEQMKHVDLHDVSHCDAERELKRNFEEFTVGEDETEDDAEDVDEEQETLTEDDAEDENPENEEMEVFTA